MKRVAFLLALSVSFAGTPVFAGAPIHSDVESTCLNEAAWPLTHSHRYLDASVQQREQISNGYDADVAANRNLCRSLGRATGPDRAAFVADCRRRLDAEARRYGADAVRQLRVLSEACPAAPVKG